MFSAFIRGGICFQVRESWVYETVGEAGDALLDGSLILLFEVNTLGWFVRLLFT